jgi:hypothetical protein
MGRGDDSLSCSVEIKNGGGCVSIPPYILMALCLISIRELLFCIKHQMKTPKIISEITVLTNSRKIIE